MTPLTSILDTRPVVTDTRNPGYQELKSRIHQDLLNRLNLDRLARVKREDAEPEIRTLIAGMLDVGFDTLKQREQRRQVQRMTAIAGIALVVLVVTIVLATFALISRHRAVIAQN